jgi:hypothetical protein
MEPCSNWTNVVYNDRDPPNQQQTTKYYETKLYSEQKGYSFTAQQDMVMYEAGMRFINLASYQSVTCLVYENHSGEMIYDAGYWQDGRGMTKEVGEPRGDYYEFKKMNLQLYKGLKYTVVFIIKCPHTETMRAEYPLCAPNHETYTIKGFGDDVLNIYQYGEEQIMPTETDLYAPFVKFCYTYGTLDGPTPASAETVSIAPPSPGPGTWQVDNGAGVFHGYEFSPPTDMKLYEISTVIKDLPVGETVQGQLWRQTASGTLAEGVLVASGTVANGEGDVDKNYQSFFVGGVDLLASETYVISWRISDETDVVWEAGSGTLDNSFNGLEFDGYTVKPKMRKSLSAPDTYPGASATVVWTTASFKFSEATD